VVNTCGVKLSGFFPCRCDEAETSILRFQYASGMGIKGDDHGFAVYLICQLFEVLNNTLMPEMHAIEGADGNHGIPEGW
jgi:hypothetical protein